MRLTKLMMDPDNASRLSAFALPSHRIRGDKVRAYAEAMRNGRWIFNAIPLVVSRNGVLLDGHHRLRASIQEGLSFPTLVASDVSEEVGHLIDRRRAGTFAGLLEARGVEDAKSVERLLQQLLNYEDGVLGRRAVRQPWSRMERVLQQNPAILESFAASNLRAAGEIPEAIRHLLVFMGRRAAPQALARLLAAMTDPEAHPPDDPGVMLRAAFRALETAGTKDPQTGRLAALGILALNAAQGDRRLRRLAWSYGQDFPRLIGYAPLPGSGPDGEIAAPLPGLDEPASAVLQRAELAIETITPATAQRYLQRNHGHRRLVRSHVQALARDMRLGRWILSPQPICFAEGGTLLNGQHRLRALIEAGVSLEMPVARNLPSAASGTYDFHSARTPAKADLPTSFGDTALVHAMANILWRSEIAPPNSARAKASAEEIRDILAKHPRLIELRTLARRSVELGRASVLGYAAYAIERQDAKLGRAFLDGLFGTGPTVAAAPVATLRRRLLRLRIARASQDEQLKAILEAWSQVLARGRL